MSRAVLTSGICLHTDILNGDLSASADDVRRTMYISGHSTAMLARCHCVSRKRQASLGRIYSFWKADLDSVGNKSVSSQTDKGQSTSPCKRWCTGFSQISFLPKPWPAPYGQTKITVSACQLKHPEPSRPRAQGEAFTSTRLKGSGSG